MYSFKNLALLVGALLPFAAAAPTQFNSRAAQAIPNKFIVTLKEDIASSEKESHLAWVSEVHARSLGRRDLAGVEKTYNISSFQGYAGTFDEATIEEIKASPEVSWTVLDQGFSFFFFWQWRLNEE